MCANTHWVSVLSQRDLKLKSSCSIRSVGGFSSLGLLILTDGRALRLVESRAWAGYGVNVRRGGVGVPWIWSSVCCSRMKMGRQERLVRN